MNNTQTYFKPEEGDPTLRPTTYVSYDKANKEKLRKQLEDCRGRGVLGDQVDPKVVKARLEHVKNVIDLQHVDRMFHNLRADGGFRRKLAERIAEERRWVKHYDDCLVEYRKGKIKKRETNCGFNVVSMLAIQEQLRTEAENERVGRSKIPPFEEKVGKVVNTTPAASKAAKGKANGQHKPGPKQGREAWKAAESAKRLAARQANGGRVGPK